MSDPELDAALAAVAAGPADESLKRVLADLLLERGDPRGEFVLLQLLIAENQASGSMRQRAAELWRRHRRAWMAEAADVLEDLSLEGGFPVSASIQRSATEWLVGRALASPMLVSLKRLKRGPEAAVLQLVCSPRMTQLQDVMLERAAALRACAERGVPHRLTQLTLRFMPSDAELRLLIGSPVFARLQRLSCHATQAAAAQLIDRLGAHPGITDLTMTSMSYQDDELLRSIARSWSASKLSSLVVPHALELSRDAEGTTLLLQNLTVEQLIAQRPHVPRDVTRVRLMPFRGPRFDLEVAAPLLAAYAGLEPKLWP